MVGTRSTVIDRANREVFLICDMSVDETSVPVESADSPRDNVCFITLVWRTPFACPLCVDADYEKQTSECEDGYASSQRGSAVAQLTLGAQQTRDGAGAHQ